MYIPTCNVTYVENWGHGNINIMGLLQEWQEGAARYLSD